jgi:hypothetical protein
MSIGEEEAGEATEARWGEGVGGGVIKEG